MTKNIHHLEQVPKAPRIIRSICAKVAGIQKVDIAIRVTCHMVVYVHIDCKEVENCNHDMILPKEDGYRYLKPALNKKRYPRLWLEEMVAELKSKKRIAEFYPALYVEWIVMIDTAEHTVAPV
jgi:hypothetical protein